MVLNLLQVAWTYGKPKQEFLYEALEELHMNLRVIYDLQNADFIDYFVVNTESW